ncbi:hypothetical protein N7512_006686 [Penicillium capsulatum]|nr:hypothetical protein N7512_006686 [Penicillium capsulatum]
MGTRDPSNRLDLEYAENVTTSTDKAYELANVMKNFLKDIRDNKEITKREAKMGDNIKNYIQWSLLEKEEKLDDKTDFGALIKSGRMITEDPHATCEAASEAFVIDSQQPGHLKINQVNLCERFLEKFHGQSAVACDKWCLKEIATVLKHVEQLTQTPIDISDKLTGTIFFQLLFTTNKDTTAKACKPRGEKNKRAEDHKDDLNVHSWADVNQDGTWATTQFVHWSTIIKDIADGKKDKANRAALIAMFLLKKLGQETLKSGVLTMA